MGVLRTFILLIVAAALLMPFFVYVSEMVPAGFLLAGAGALLAIFSPTSYDPSDPKKKGKPSIVFRILGVALFGLGLLQILGVLELYVWGAEYLNIFLGAVGVLLYLSAIRADRTFVKAKKTGIGTQAI